MEYRCHRWSERWQGAAVEINIVVEGRGWVGADGGWMSQAVVWMLMRVPERLMLHRWMATNVPGRQLGGVPLCWMLLDVPERLMLPRLMYHLMLLHR